MEINQTVNEFVILGFSNLGQFWPFFFTLLLIVYILIITGNVLISLVILVDRHLHSPMYFFICMLSFLELWYTAVTIPCMLVMYLFHSLGITENYLLNVMAYDRFVAICKPLRYHTIMTSRSCKILVCGCWLLGFMSPITLLILVSQLPFCGPNEVHHLFCDSSALLNLACIDTSLNIIIDFAISLCMVIVTSLFIILTYIKIVVTIMKMSTAEGRRKAFSTCVSHLTVVLIFYGMAINYSVLTPLFSPIIYSFRNKEIKNSLKKFLQPKILSRNVQHASNTFT
ncbi:hypothetical protein FKM82_015950 [Ascaphus truei]